MKRIKFLFASFLATILFSINAIGQDVSYKGATLLRGTNEVAWEKDLISEDSLKRPESAFSKRMLFVNNSNEYPVEICYEIKLGSKDAPWQKEKPVIVSPDKLVAEDQLYGHTRSQCILIYDKEIKAISIKSVSFKKSK